MTTLRFARLIPLGLGIALLTALPSTVFAGIFGVPTNVSTTTGAVCTGAGVPDAGCTAASGNPPGWLVLAGTTFGGGAASGDTVHQMRFYIEVTGPTLQIKVFDPGTGTGAGANGARDNNTTNLTTRYRLLDPAGNNYNAGGGAAEGGPLAIVNDAVAGVITEDRLVQFGCVAGAAPAFALTNATNFFGTGSTGGAACATALQPGLYIFEVTISVDGNAANAFGVQFTNSAGAHYNSYVVGRSDDANTIVPPSYDNAFIAGRISEGAGTRANITEPMTLFPRIDRSCTFQTSNTDGGLNIAGEGAGAVATVTGPDGVARTLTVSNNNDHSENTFNHLPSTGPNYTSNNYGIFRIQHSLGGTTLNNWVDWRAADSIAWGTSSPGTQPNYGLIPVQMFLPNGYTGCDGTSGSCTFTAPVEPIFTTSAVWVSGPNPPAIGSATVHNITVSLYNPTSVALTNVQLISPLTSATTYVGGSVATFIDGAASGTPTAPGAAAIGAFASLPAGSTASLQYQVSTTPTVTGNFQLTGLAPAQVFGVTGIAVAAGPPVVATVTTAGAHGYAVGDRVRLAGMNQDGLNGVFTVASTPSGTTFTVRVPTPGTAAGTVPAGRLSYAQAICRAALNQPACATYEPAWRSTTGAAGTAADSPGLGYGGPACDLRANAVGGPVDLTLTKTDSPDPVALGSNITYTIAVSNVGVAAAPNVQWTDTLPAGTSFVSLTPNVNWTCTTPQVGATGNVICIRTTSMPVGGPENFTLVVAVDSGVGSVSNTATVTSAGQELTPANNTQTATTAITTGADLRILKSGSPNAQISGGNITFTIPVSNVGPATANAPVVTDTLPGGGPWRFQAITATGYTCVTPAVNATGVITCTRTANMPAGTTDTIQLTLSIVSPTGPITNTASVTSTTADPVPGNNSSTDTTTVVTTCSPTANGTLTTGVINDYWPGTASAAVGATSITLGARIAGGAGSTIAVGDYLLVIQMQDGTFNSSDTDAYGNGIPGDIPSTASPGLRASGTAASGSLLIGNVGKYEYVIAAGAVGAAGGALTITAPLKNSYTTGAPAFNAGGSNGQRTFQVVRVPVYNNLTLTGNMLAAPWLGTTNANSGGGVLAIEVNGTLTLAGFGFDASGRGFRGGRGLGAGNNNSSLTAHVFQNDTGVGVRGAPTAADNFGFKGEGINGTPSDLWNGTALVAGASGYPGTAATNGDRGMGAPGNAGGGGSWDAAGAGGANAGAGGGGGDEYCTAPGCQPGDLSSVAHTVGWTGGRGGLLSFTPTFDRIVMGGGGGGGADHNAPNDGHGGVGGGIIMARTVNVAGTGTIAANGANAPTETGTGNAGGGGAGGSIIFTASGGAIPATVTINANGGNGSNATDHAPGAGAGGGVIFVSPGSLAVTSVTGGNNGFRTGAFPGNTNAEPGADGFTSVMAAAPPPASADACGPVVDLSVTILAPDTATAGSNISYPVTVRNNGPVSAPNTTLLLPVPPNSTFVSITAPAGWTCTTPLVGATGTVSCSRTGGNMAAFTSEAFTFVTRVDPGTAAGTVIPVAASVGTSANEDNTANNTYNDNTVIQQATTPALTRASIRGLSANPGSGRIEFATGMQRGTASFNVYALDDPRDFRTKRLLNPAPILAPFPNSVAPIVYSLQAAPFRASHILIEETELSGRVREMGPFAVGDSKMEVSLGRIRNRLTRSGASPTLVGGVDVTFLPSGGNARLARDDQRNKNTLRAQRGERRGRRITHDGLKIKVAGGGPVAVRRIDLEADGLPSGAQTRHLRLSLFGRAVPFTVSGTGPAEEIHFDALPVETTYTGDAVYLLSWSGKRLSPPTAELSREADDHRPGFTRIERSYVYLAGAARGTDPWLWDLVVGDGTPWPYSYDPSAGNFDLPGLSSSAAAPIRVKLSAYSPLVHQVRAFVNDVEIGSVEFEGSTVAAIDGVVPAGVLRASGNQLEIRYSAANATGDDPGYLYLDYIELAADIASAPRRTLAAAAIEPYSSALPSGALNADYAILTHGDFLEQAQALATLKRAQGRRPVVVDVNRLYDRYSAGFLEAAAIREFIKEAASKRLRDVVIFGDDTIDYRNFYGQTEFPVVPSLMGWDFEYGRVPSENQFADVDGDGGPDVSIGRLPAQTDADADVLIAKIERQQTVLRGQQGRHLIVVDNQSDGDPSFKELAAQVASTHFKTSPVAWAEVSDGVVAARAAFTAGLQSAPAITHYFGHGGPEIWADEQVLTVDDAPSLAGLPESVYFQWACETQYFPYFYGRSLGEALLLQPNGGALASVGPSGISDAQTQSLFYQVLYGQLAEPGITLGEAIRRAKSVVLAQQPQARGVVEGFNLIGDPSVTLGALTPTTPARSRRR